MLAYLDRVPLPLPVLHFDDLLLQEPLKGVLARLMGGDVMAQVADKKNLDGTQPVEAADNTTRYLQKPSISSESTSDFI